MVASFSVSTEEYRLLLLSSLWRWENKGNRRLMYFESQPRLKAGCLQNPFPRPLCCPAPDFELMIHACNWVKLNSFNSAHWQVSDKATANSFSGWGWKALTTQATLSGMHSNCVVWPFSLNASHSCIVVIGCMGTERGEVIYCGQQRHHWTVLNPVAHGDLRIQSCLVEGIAWS